MTCPELRTVWSISDCVDQSANAKRAIANRRVGVMSWRACAQKIGRFMLEAFEALGLWGHPAQFVD